MLYKGLGADYYTHPPGIVSLLMLTITYIPPMTLHFHIQGKFNDHTECSLYRIHGHSTSVMAVMKMGNIVPKVAHLWHSGPVCCDYTM